MPGLCTVSCPIPSDLCDLILLGPSTGEITFDPIPTSIEPGTFLSVTLTIDTASFTPSRVYVFSNHDGQFIDCNSQPCSTLQTDITVPQEAFGELTLTAVALTDTTTQAVAVSQVVTFVAPSSDLAALAIEPDTVFLFDYASTRRVDVIGIFADGFERIVSGADNGTIYKTLNPAIATVDCDGFITGHVQGETFLVVSNTFDPSVTAIATIKVVTADLSIPGPAPLIDCNGNGFSDECDIAAGFSEDVDQSGIPDECEDFQSYRRGDCNDDSVIDIADGIFILNFLFLGGESGSCFDSCDTNADLAVDVSDPLFLFSYLLLKGPLPPAPFPDCGVAAGVEVDCAAFNSCP